MSGDQIGQALFVTAGIFAVGFMIAGACAGQMSTIRRDEQMGTLAVVLAVLTIVTAIAGVWTLAAAGAL